MNNNPNGDTSPRLALMAILATISMWASSYVIIRWLASEVTPPSLAFLRVFTGAMALTGLFVWKARGSAKGVSCKAIVLSFPMGILLFAGFMLTVNWAGQLIDAGTISMLTNLAPLIVAVGATVFFREKSPRNLLPGMALSFTGVGIIAYGGGVGQLNLMGLAAGLLAALCYGAGMLVQKKSLQYIDPIGGTLLAAWVGTLVLSPFSAEAFGELSEVPLDVVLWVVYLGVGPMAVGFWLWGYALTMLPAGQVATASFAVPVIAMGMSAVALAELPPRTSIVGGALCLAGVVISQWRRR